MKLLSLLKSAPLALLLAASPATRPAREPTDRPAPKLERGALEHHFAELHSQFLTRRTSKTRLLFFGASIIERWRLSGLEIYHAHFDKYDPDDFGVSGDKTQHVLWRIDQGELDGMDPRVVVIHVGNNNVEADSVDEVVRGVTAVVDAVHRKLPRSRVLLMSFFPRGADPENPQVASLRAKIKKVNVQLAKLDDGDRTRVLDIGDKFLDVEGVIRYSMMNDAMHPTAKSYEIWAAQMQPLLDEMMASPPPSTRPADHDAK